MNILHVTSHLEYSGAAKELAVLARHQSSLGDNVRVCCLGSRGPWTDRLEAAAIPVETLAWTRAFDAVPAWRLREVIRESKADLVHVWGLPALRWVGLVAKFALLQVVVSPPLMDHSQTGAALDRWLLRRVKKIVVRDEFEESWLRQRRIPHHKIAFIPPGIVVNDEVSPERLRGDDGPTRIVGLGPLEKHKNFRDAIWTMDILNYIFPDLELDLVGRGTHESPLRAMAQQIENQKISFRGRVTESADILSEAGVCWLTAKSGSRHAALEAMASGRPLVASDLPHLRVMVPDGEAGYLVPQGDKIALARKTRELLINPDLRRKIGAAARRHVSERFSQEANLERWTDLVRAA